jgi:hypothetical protein
MKRGLATACAASPGFISEFLSYSLLLVRR